VQAVSSSCVLTAPNAGYCADTETRTRRVRKVAPSKREFRFRAFDQMISPNLTASDTAA
jgi:hypothetical protein